MFFQEHKIAQAEYAAYEAKFNRRSALEGATIRVPNIFDRMFAAVMRIANSRATEAGQKSNHTRYIHGSAPAK